MREFFLLGKLFFNYEIFTIFMLYLTTKQIKVAVICHQIFKMLSLKGEISTIAPMYSLIVMLVHLLMLLLL